MQAGPAHGKTAGRAARVLLDRQGLPHGISRQGAGFQQILKAARKHDLAPVLPGPRPHVDHIIRDGNHIPVVLHHKNRVPFVPQLPQQIVHAVDVPRVHPRAGLVKNIGQSGQTAAHVPDQLQPLGLPAGQGRRLPVQMQVGQTDRDHPVQPLRQSLHQHVHRRVCDLQQNLAEPGQLHLTHVRDGIAVYLTAQSRPVQPLPMALRTLHPGDHALGLLPGMPALIADIPVQQRFRIFVVQARHLGILRLPRSVPGTVQQQIILFLGVLPHRLVQVEQAGGGVLLPVPGTRAEQGILDTALVPGLVPVDHRLHVQPCNRSQARTGPAHPVGVIEGKAGSRAHIGAPDSRKQQPQAGVQAADGAHRGAGVSAQGRLIHHHGSRQVVDSLHRRFGIFWEP